MVNTGAPWGQGGRCPAACPQRGWSGTCLVEPTCQSRGHGLEPARTARESPHTATWAQHGPNQSASFRRGAAVGAAGARLSSDGFIHSRSPAPPLVLAPPRVQGSQRSGRDAPPPAGRGWGGRVARASRRSRGLPRRACQCGGHGPTPCSGGVPPVPEQLSPDSTATEPELWSPGTGATEARAP